MAQQLEQTLASGLGEDYEAIRHRSQWNLVWYRFRRDKVAMVGATIVILLILAAIFAPWLAPHDPSTIFDSGLTLDGTPSPPTRQFPLGADALGRDQLSRILYGARVSLTIGIAANGLAMIIGIGIGSIGGYFKGWVSGLSMRLTDIMMSFPILLLAIALVAVLKPSIWIVIFVIAFSYWAPVARIIHGQVLGIKDRDFVDAARALGVGHRAILIRHILPQGGNMDTRFMRAGTTLYLPVEVDEALLSLGDLHAAQGDGEICGTAIETSGTVTLSFTLHQGRNLRFPSYGVDGRLTRTSEERGYFATTGIGPDLLDATRDAARGMISYLGEEHGLSELEAYALCSVAADLKISEVVDYPNWVVSYFLPNTLFTP